MAGGGGGNQEFSLDMLSLTSMSFPGGEVAWAVGYTSRTSRGIWVSWSYLHITSRRWFQPWGGMTSLRERVGGEREGVLSSPTGTGLEKRKNQQEAEKEHPGR